MIELISDKSYMGKDIEAWANDNQGSNDIALRIKRKYFTGDNSPEKCSFYFVNVTSNGGIVLKRDFRRSPKYNASRRNRAS